MLNYHERAAERLNEMAGSCAPRAGEAEPGGRLPDRQPRPDDGTARPAEARQVATRDGPEDAAQPRGGGGRTARASSDTPVGERRRRAGNSSDRRCRSFASCPDAKRRTHADRDRHQVVQPRPGVRLPLHPRALDERPRDVRPRPPTRDKGPMAAHVDRTGVWDQPGVTEASDCEVPFEEYERWVADNGSRPSSATRTTSSRRSRGSASRASRRSAGSSGRSSAPTTPSRRSAPTTSSTR